MFASDYEHVSLPPLDAGELLFTEAISGGAEIMVLAGELHADGETFFCAMAVYACRPIHH